MPRVLGRNKHQKAAHRVGEKRLGADELPQLLEFAESADAEERLTAAQHLCPCHLRRRVDAAWSALYRLLEDPDPRVRFAAWHTLEDGGHPDDPALAGIIERALREERDPKVRGMIKQVVDVRARQAAEVRSMSVRRPATERGRCDFCGRSGVLVQWDTTTVIPGVEGDRIARICNECGHQGR